MKTAASLILAGGMVVGVVLLLFIFTGDWSGVDHAARGRELDAQLAEALRRIEAKELVVRDVIAGRVGLLEAVARYRHANADLSLVIHGLALRYPGVPYELALCHQIIEDVKLHGPEQMDQIVSRLEAELAAFNGQRNLP
jgi:hypothetical protein